MPARTSLRFAAPALLSLALLAACSESGDQDSTATTTTTTEASADPTEAVLTAVESSSEESSFTYELDMELQGPGEQQALSYDGKVDAASETGEASFSADGRGELTARVFGAETYLTTDNDRWTDLLDGKTWLHVQRGDVDGVGTLADLDTGRNVLYRLMNASDVEAEGTDEVDGTEVQTYSFSLDPEVSDDVPDDRQEGVAALLRATGSGVLSIEGTVGIGTEDGLIHSVGLDGGVRAPSDDESDDPRFTITYDGTFSGYGEEIDVDEPDPSDTAEFADAPREILGIIQQIQQGD